MRRGEKIPGVHGRKRMIPRPLRGKCLIVGARLRIEGDPCAAKVDGSY